MVFERLQPAFHTTQSHLFHLKLVPNTAKTKGVLFSNKKRISGSRCLVKASYRHSEILTDENLYISTWQLCV